MLLVKDGIRTKVNNLIPLVLGEYLYKMYLNSEYVPFVIVCYIANLWKIKTFVEG